MFYRQSSTPTEDKCWQEKMSVSVNNQKQFDCSFLRGQRLETIQLIRMYHVQLKLSMQFLSYMVFFLQPQG